MMVSKFTNRLINESSPYLLQHAHNPVDWYPWGEEALQKAKALNIPILVSIGYSACHWCHVMEHESFENEEVAAFMNKHFINIKIDREERPDLDQIYMDAVQAISGSGGWPLNVFLTPGTKPFYGGTYFPPVKAFNRPSWKEILIFISDVWNSKREEILQQADTLLQHIHDSGNQLLKNLSGIQNKSEKKFTTQDCKIIAENILSKADLLSGGIGAAPKFPQTFTLQYLLMFGHFFGDKASKQHALFSLKQMLNGGIYDHLAGGLSRYSTDNEWLAPHFEKMLYDNALLVNVLCDAYQVSKEDFFLEGINKTLLFLLNEMKHADGGFYAALDADTEGVEGKFYVWDKKEIETIIKDDSDMCCNWYGVSIKGNWEHKNILHIQKETSLFAKQNNITLTDLKSKINKWNAILLEVRNTRPRPGIDDKILLGWNALLLTAFCKSYAALNNKLYKDEAIALFDFIRRNFKNKSGGYFHSYKNGRANHQAFLDDYAYLAQSCIYLQEITSDQKYIEEAKDICMYVLNNFSDTDTGMFSFTHKDQKDVLVRKTDVYDGAIPSGNSIMAENLFYLSVILNNVSWMEKADQMLSVIKELILKYPTSFGVWAVLLCKQCIGIPEIVVTGRNTDKYLKEVLEIYLPNKVLQSANSLTDYPLLRNKNFEVEILFYLCRQYSCSIPVNSIIELKQQLFKEFLNTNIHNI